MKIKFEPPLTLPPKSTAEVDVEACTGRARVIIRSIDTGFILEERPDCQMIEADGLQIIVAAPGSIQYPKLSWKRRLLHWLAKG